jgi:hypothetical protein
MANVIINDTHLTNIADAIREKTGTSDTYKPGEMATAIQAIPQEGGGGGEGIPEEAFYVTSNCNYKFYNGQWDWFLERYGDKITTENISSATNMFSSIKLEKIPFAINLDSSKTGISLSDIFYDSELKELPKLNAQITKIPTSQYNFLDIKDIFTSMKYLREIPDDYLTSIVTEGYWQKRPGNGVAGACNYCYSLRKQINLIPFISYSGTSSYSSAYYNLYNGCYVLDEVINLPVETGATYTSNAFVNTFKDCYRVKNITFETSSTGAPAVANWKSQTMDLRTVGWTSSAFNITDYNSGITADKEVKEYNDYLALKDDPDWFTCNRAFSRYTRSSAVRTINSLPDTSAYLTANGGTNTIMFKESSGALINGGEEEMDKLTEAEIAVAAAKGWTVSISG